MKNVLLIFLLSNILLSCTKFGRTDTVKGKVINHITGNGIEGRRVVLLKEESGIGGGSKIIKETTTNSEGNFEINAGRLKALEVSVVDDGKYFVLGWYNDNELISSKYSNRKALNKGKRLNANFHVVEYGEYILNIKAINCEGPNDIMVFKGTSELEEPLEVYSTDRLGCYEFVSGTIKKPEGKYTYELQVNRASGITNLTFEFYNSANSVDTFDLFY